MLQTPDFEHPRASAIRLTNTLPLALVVLCMPGLSCCLLHYVFPDQLGVTGNTSDCITHSTMCGQSQTNTESARILSDFPYLTEDLFQDSMPQVCHLALFSRCGFHTSIHIHISGEGTIFSFKISCIIDEILLQKT